MIGCSLAIFAPAEARAAGQARPLTDAEMELLTVGAAADARASAVANSLGSNPLSVSSATTLASAGTSLIPGAPLLNYATTQTVAYASGSGGADATSTTRVVVDGGNGGVEITTTARASGTGNVQTQAQWYAVSTNSADLAFGTVSASACCGQGAEAQVQIGLHAGGPHTDQRVVTRQPVAPGGTGQTVDASIVSSTLPIVDSALVAAATSARLSSKY